MASADVVGTAPVSDPSPSAERCSSVRVVTRRDALAEAWPAIEQLQERVSAPVTARRCWQELWLECTPDAQPLVVLVEGQETLLAAAPLAVLPGRVRRVVPIGHGRSDEVVLPAVDQRASSALAWAVRAALGHVPGPWRLTLSRLRADDPLLPALLAVLPHASAHPQEGAPQLALGADRQARSYVSRNHHQQVRRMENRLSREGRSVTVRHVRGLADVRALLPQVERLFRARDAMVGRPCDLDDPRLRRFFHGVLERHAERGELVLSTLQVDDHLGAYVVCFADGAARRMWHCRFDPALAGYGIGRLALHASLQHALSDPRCALYDWMEGEEAYKSQVSDRVQEYVIVCAASSWLQWGLTEPARRARRGTKELVKRHQRLDRAVRRARAAVGAA